MKFEGEPDLHLFTNESYLFLRWSNPAWRLTGARSRVRIAVDYEEGRAQSDFWIYNRGGRRDDVALEPVEL